MCDLTQKGQECTTKKTLLQLPNYNHVFLR